VVALAETAHRHGARIAVDAAQLAVHRRVSLADWAWTIWRCPGTSSTRRSARGFSPVAPTGSTRQPPYLAGGGATAEVGDAAQDVRLREGPSRHEAGTPNLLGAVALAAACGALAATDRPALAAT